MQNIPFKGFLTDLLEGLARKAYPSSIRQSLYYVHPDEKMFIYDFRHDLTAADCPSPSAGEYIVMDFKVPKSAVWIIKGFVPYAMERTDVGGVTESARYITPQDGNGWFSFAPVAAGGPPFVITTNYNAPQNDDGNQQDALRQRSNGISQVSLNPYTDAVWQMQNAFFTMAVHSEQRFQTIFSLMGPPASGGTGTPISNPYSIGTPTAPANKRVDFAGVVVAGLMMSENAYREAARLFGKE